MNTTPKVQRLLEDSKELIKFIEQVQLDGAKRFLTETLPDAETICNLEEKNVLRDYELDILLERAGLSRLKKYISFSQYSEKPFKIVFDRETTLNGKCIISYKVIERFGY